MEKSSDAMDVDDCEADEILKHFGNVSIAGTCKPNEDEMLVPPSSPKIQQKMLDFTGKHELPESVEKRLASKQFQVGQ